MSFKFFRKYQKAMLWGVVVLTVLTFSLFSVQSTMRACLEQETGAVAEFVLKDGTKVTIDVARFNEVRRYIPALFELFRRGEKYTLDDVFTHIIFHEEAMQSGVTVTDKELEENIIGLFGSAPDSDTYKDIVTNRLYFPSVGKFEETLREYLVVEKLKSYFFAGSDIVLTEDAYAEYAKENEQFKIEYLAFRSGDYSDEISPDTVAKEDIDHYYEGIDPYSPSVKEQYTIPEEFAFQMGYIDMTAVDLETFAERIAEIELEPWEATAYYRTIRERFRIDEEKEPDDGADDAEEGATPDPEPESEPGTAPEDDPESDPGGEPEEAEAETDPAAEAEPEEEPVPQYTPQEEVQESLEKELKVIKVMEQAFKEWNAYTKENDLVAKPDRLGQMDPEEENGDDENTGDDDTPKEEVDPDAFFQKLCDDYGFTFQKIDEMISLDALKEMETFGSADFERRAGVQSQRKNSCIMVKPNQDNLNVAFLARVTDKVDRQKKPIDDIRDDVTDEYVEKKRMELARDKITAFRESMEERVKEFDDIKVEVDAFLLEAEKKADARIAASEDELDEDQIERIRLSEERAAEWRIKRLLNKHLGRVFNDLCAEEGLTVKEMEYFSKNVTAMRDVIEKAEGAEKFLMRENKITMCDKGEVTHTLEDRENEVLYLAHIVDRRDPFPEEMTLKDVETHRQRLKQEKFRQLTQSMSGRGAGPMPGSMIPPIEEESGGKPEDAILSPRNVFERYQFRFLESSKSNEEE